MNSIHLTEEQLDDVLMGDAAAETTAHLEHCADCREQITEMQFAIRSFTTTTMSWSERRSATMPQQPATEGSAWNRKLNWSLAAAVIAVTAIVLPLATRNSPGGMNMAAKDEAQATTQTASAATAASRAPAVYAVSTTTRPAAKGVVERDNRMLQAINAELDASVESPVQTFDVDTPQGGGSQNHGLPIPISD
jgi:hypothetical protein